MEQYNVAIARAALPAILRLGSLIAPYSSPLKPYQPAGNNIKWRDLARERGLLLSDDQNIGNHTRVMRRDLVPRLNVLAQLSMLGEAAGMMPDTPYGQQLGSGHLFFPQVVDNRVQIAINANYRMFATGYAEVKLHVGAIHESAIREYTAYAWGRLALDQVVTELPDDDTELGTFQIGPRQVSAVAEYMEELRGIPR